VVASLLVSVVLLGFKMSALKRLVQVNQRRAELKAALVLLQPKLEDEDLAAWLDDCDEDKVQRQSKICELALPSGREYNAMENESIAKCLRMFALFERNSVGARELPRPATITRLETKYDEVTRLLLGLATAQIRAHPLEIVAYFLNADCRFMLSSYATDAHLVRHELLECVNAHHTIVFRRSSFGATQLLF
jgi:hypothetical protein